MHRTGWACATVEGAGFSTPKDTPTFCPQIRISVKRTPHTKDV